MLTCSDQSTQKNSYIIMAYQRFKLKFAFACDNNANDKNEYQSFVCVRRFVKIHVLRMRN